MGSKNIITELFCENFTVNYCDLMCNIKKNIGLENTIDNSLSSNFVQHIFLKEIRNIIENQNVRIFFGNSLNEMKIVISDNCCREHEVVVICNDNMKYVVSFTSIPFTSLDDVEFSSLNEIIDKFNASITNLTHYFDELEQIDRMCYVIEPVKQSFKEDYRKILLDDRIWLHIAVSSDGTACNIHLIGHNDEWNSKLENGLKHWDHDKDIVQNLMTVFGLSSFPKASPSNNELGNSKNDLTCGICLCHELQVDDNFAVPLPLCSNVRCGVYFHKDCLYQWLVACMGGRQPPLGVIVGTCPACSVQISCSD